ncbi:MAG: NAD(P)/FAD-dependent oxidoreductase [Geodermatophilaceae bacterium]|nr:NAD(P)/FAD-dependent oxidoreductase [Geodermatophilaceae bacterium]
MTSAPEPVVVDILIVGAGPVGLYGAYYAGFRGLKVALIDSLPEAGGQVTAMYPEKQIFDVGGFPTIKGRELVANLVAQAAPFEPIYLLGEQAASLERIPASDDGPDTLVVTASSGILVRAKAVIVSSGIGTFTPRPLPNGSSYENRGLSYFVPDLAPYAGQDVVIVGGGDSAFDWALALEPLARSVHLIHRRDKFRAHEHSVSMVRATSVQIVTNAQVREILGTDQVEGVDIAVSEQDEPLVLSCQRIIAALGFTANLGPLLQWGLDIQHHRHIPVDSAMRTAQPGIFAAGDITEYDGKVRLISVGFGEIATAVCNAAHHMNPAMSVFPGHSSDIAPPPPPSPPPRPSAPPSAPRQAPAASDEPVPAA